MHLRKLESFSNYIISYLPYFYSRHTAAAAKLLQLCPTLWDPIDGSPPGFPCPWDSPGKNTGVGCHFLLQCMKVKSESEVAQSCLTLCDPMDHSLPGSSAHGIFQARVLEWGAIAFSSRHANTILMFFRKWLLVLASNSFVFTDQFLQTIQETFKNHFDYQNLSS